MKHISSKLGRLALLAATSAILAACGGSDGDGAGIERNYLKHDFSKLAAEGPFSKVSPEDAKATEHYRSIPVPEGTTVKLDGKKVDGAKNIDIASMGYGKFHFLELDNGAKKDTLYIYQTPYAVMRINSLVMEMKKQKQMHNGIFLVDGSMRYLKSSEADKLKSQGVTASYKGFAASQGDKINDLVFGDLEYTVDFAKMKGEGKITGIKNIEFLLYDMNASKFIDSTYISSLKNVDRVELKPADLAAKGDIINYYKGNERFGGTGEALIMGKDKVLEKTTYSVTVAGPEANEVHGAVVRTSHAAMPVIPFSGFRQK